jgi:type I restriction enzyme S subunit
VLISRLADPIGRACIFPGDARPCVTVVDVALFRGAQAGGVDHIWLKNSINAQQFRSEIDQAASGTTRKRISRKNLGSLPLPLPPLNEQRRIVAKIEALQERSKAAKDALDAIPPLLEKFRQSVLAAAFRGDLTKSWRERQPEIEPATVLLDRIRAERRRRFTEANPKKKYIEPAPRRPVRPAGASGGVVLGASRGSLRMDHQGDDPGARQDVCRDGRGPIRESLQSHHDRRTRL